MPSTALQPGDMYSERSGLWLHLFLSSWICGEVPYLIIAVVVVFVFFSFPLLSLHITLIYTRFTIKQNTFLVPGRSFVFLRLKPELAAKITFLLSKSTDGSVQTMNAS